MIGSKDEKESMTMQLDIPILHIYHNQQVPTAAPGLRAAKVCRLLRSSAERQAGAECEEAEH